MMIWKTERIKKCVGWINNNEAINNLMNSNFESRKHDKTKLSANKSIT